jgi:hypothetical protein
MPIPLGFSEALQDYLNNALTAQAENRHHDYRRSLFLDFLKRAFGLKVEEFEVEKFLRIDVRQHGWIDALFRALVFEFKRDLAKEREDGLRELRDYLRTLAYGAESVGLLTDGLRFETYVLDGDALRRTDTFDLAQADAEAAFLWLDSYLFSQKNTPPTSADIVRRFGAQSPTFQTAARGLSAMLDRLNRIPTLDIKQRQWRLSLAIVYGSDVGENNDELFIRHTYLNLFAKLLAYVALGGIAHDEDTLADIVSGKAFYRFGVSNVGEFDFFTWVLTPQVRDDTLRILRRLAASLVVYDLTSIREDLFKQLYQNLVDPETRHDLGEYYTPNWLAELTLQEIDYRPGQSLLDPSCGSGTFLFTAIRRLVEQGMSGWDLVDFALDHIAGMDVHPLAVTVARINYLLGILPHMHGPRTKQEFGYLNLPVYMANTLLTPAEDNILHIPVDPQRGEEFVIPLNAMRAGEPYGEIIRLMEEYARQPEAHNHLFPFHDFFEAVRDSFGAAQNGVVDVLPTVWGQNIRLLSRLIAENRDSIWVYLLQNLPRPLIFQARRFDVVVGNPPWLSYRYIRDKGYQDQVRNLTITGYELLERGDTKLFTQMDLSTLFMVHCETVYLRPGGTIAFVMPRSVITGAKQHRRFQARGFTRVVDLLGVSPLFNVPSCVVIRQADAVFTDAVPTRRYRARLPEHEMRLADAAPLLKVVEAETRLLGEVTIASSHYYEQFKVGASMFPRNLCFVRPTHTLRPGDQAVLPSMESDPDLNADSKAPWKGVRLAGDVFPPNLYATLLSKNLVPFGYRRLHLVALPVYVSEEGALLAADKAEFSRRRHLSSWDTWFEPAEQKWDELRKDISRLQDLMDRYNYQGLLLAQRPFGVYKVLYNSSGTHISACVMDTRGAPPKVYEYPTQAFIVDYKTYYLDTDSADEAHYLCALLNAPVVDAAIKAHQTRGIYKGERDISRTPFEACAIPPFDPASADHLELARLSREAHAVIAQTEITGSVYKARDIARAAVAAQIAAIDEIARRVLGLE